MKQNKTDNGKRLAKPSVSKVGTMLGSGALALLAIGTISVFALTGTSVKTIDSTKAAEITTTSSLTDATEGTYTSISKVEWRKASIDEYEVAQTETTTAKQTTKETSKAAKTEISDTKATTTTKSTTQTKKSESVATKAATVATTKATTAAQTVQTTTSTAAQTITQAPTTTIAGADDVISYTDEEFDMFCYVVQGEVGNCSENYKIAVANVIINRVKSNQFPNSIKGVLTANNQFTAINGYYNNTTPPNQNTVECVKRALKGEDNSNGATFYYSPDYCSGSTAAWFESLQFCLEFDNARFFKNW